MNNRTLLTIITFLIPTTIIFNIYASGFIASGNKYSSNITSIIDRPYDPLKGSTVEVKWRTHKLRNFRYSRQLDSIKIGSNKHKLSRSEREDLTIQDRHQHNFTTALTDLVHCIEYIKNQIDHKGKVTISWITDRVVISYTDKNGHDNKALMYGNFGAIMPKDNWHTLRRIINDMMG